MSKKEKYGGLNAKAYKLLEEELDLSSKIVLGGVCPNPDCLVGKIPGATCAMKGNPLATHGTCLEEAEKVLMPTA